MPSRGAGRQRSSGSSSIARHLSTLRWRLTALYCASSAIGLIVLATFATVIDIQLRTNDTDQELRRRASVAASLLFYDEGKLHTEAISDDEIKESPTIPIVVFEHAGERSREIYATPARKPLADLSTLATTVHNDENDRGVFRDIETSDGRSYRAVAVPFYTEKGNRVAGAVIAAVDPAMSNEEHRRLVVLIWSGCAGLVVLSSIAGWVLAGRSLRPARASIEQQEEFLANAAHELRTPVARVRTVVESAQLSARLAQADLARADLHDGTRQNLRELDEELARAITLADQTSHTVDNLLTLARMDADAVALERVPLRLDQLAASVADAYPEAALGALAPVIVEGDPVLLRRAMENLIENAIVHTRVDEDDVDVPPAPIVLSLGTTQHRATMTIEDRGPGIPVELIDHLFSRFRAGSASRGSGLGLAIVHWIVTAHDGTITAANRAAIYTASDGTTTMATESDTGAVFTIVVPVAGGGILTGR